MEVYVLFNIFCVGLIVQNELVNMVNIDVVVVKQVVQCYFDFIVGLKVWMSSSVVGENGIMLLVCVKVIQQENDDLLLMVYIGNNLLNFDEIVDLLSSGDIIIYCYNGKLNCILNFVGELCSFIICVLQCGVCFDVGYGIVSFSFEVVWWVIVLGILLYIISFDIYCCNWIDGLVCLLVLVMLKFFVIGMMLLQVIDCVIVSVVEGLCLLCKGWLEVGFDVDLMLFCLEYWFMLLVDVEKESLQVDNILVLLVVICVGKGYLIE